MMISYKDMTFCNYYPLCKNGNSCERALTPQIKKDAEKWWGNEDAPICQFAELPDCFIRFFEGGTSCQK